jgi:hypothetical protein
MEGEEVEGQEYAGLGRDAELSTVSPAEGFGLRSVGWHTHLRANATWWLSKAQERCGR